MEILKFDEGDTKPKSRKFSSRGSILVAAVAIMFGASTALAGGTLTINGASNTVEIGQGVAKTVQCDGDLFLSLATTYVPSDGAFKLSQIKITDINDGITDNDGIGCRGKTLTVKLYNSTSETAAFCSDSLDSENGCNTGGTSVSKTVGSGDTSLTFNLTPTLAIATADTIKNITIVSSNA